ncbi:Serine/threonine-protein kinase haspin [Cichlidogyrus casuarinus]|uniref:Serine/threonine-protein kinase haspin n=1 Tax=Cichlidogyrus casuarinus TaxID=1844966 RepID=A0ABD2QK47_9PLAT
MNTREENGSFSAKASRFLKTPSETIACVRKSLKKLSLNKNTTKVDSPGDFFGKLAEATPVHSKPRSLNAFKSALKELHSPIAYGRQDYIPETPMNVRRFTMGRESLCLMSARKTDAFIKRITRNFSSSDFSVLVSCIGDDPHKALFKLANQSKFYSFTKYFTEKSKDVKKLGEGSFAEVFLCPHRVGHSTAVKLMPIEGEVTFNDSKQKKINEIFPELLIAQSISSLQPFCSVFSVLDSVRLIRGAFTSKLIKCWEDYDACNNSENDHPVRFPKHQLWIACESAFAGYPLEDACPPCPLARLAIWKQVAAGLAVAEDQLSFEHRDLHWGNILVLDSLRETSSPSCAYCLESNRFENFKLGGHDINIESHGVKPIIIDFTLSRITYKGEYPIFLDLGKDPELFECEGDYQFDIYRLMRRYTKYF